MTDSSIHDLSGEQTNFRELLNDHRKAGVLTDVELKLGDKRFPAHRAILSLYSPVLAAAVSGRWSTTKICPISDQNVDAETMEDLLNFLYTGKIKLTPSNAHSVFVAAHFLQIPRLLEISVEYLCKQITNEDVLPLFVFSTHCELTNLKNSCLRFIFVNHEKVLQDPRILEFSPKSFKDLIFGLKELFGDSIVRENTFHLIVRWTEKDQLERLNELPVLLENIPLERLSFEFLTKTVSTHPLVKESFPCIQALVKAFSGFKAISNSQSNLIVIGFTHSGSDLDVSISWYDSQSRAWKKVLSYFLHNKVDFSAAVVNQQDIVICGGIDRRDGRCNLTGTVDMFEWKTQTWTKLPDMPIAMRKPLIAVHDKRVYVAGGRLHKPGSDLSSVLCYSFETKQWKYVKSMSNKRSHGSMILYKDHLYAIGGMTNTVERYDPVLDEWRIMASMKSCNNFAEAILHQDKIYAFGRNNREVSFQAYAVRPRAECLDFGFGAA